MNDQKSLVSLELELRPEPVLLQALASTIHWAGQCWTCGLSWRISLNVISVGIARKLWSRCCCCCSEKLEFSRHVAKLLNSCWAQESVGTTVAPKPAPLVVQKGLLKSVLHLWAEKVIVGRPWRNTHVSNLFPGTRLLRYLHCEIHPLHCCAWSAICPSHHLQPTGPNCVWYGH